MACWPAACRCNCARPENERQTGTIRACRSGGLPPGTRIDTGHRGMVTCLWLSGNPAQEFTWPNRDASVPMSPRPWEYLVNWPHLVEQGFAKTVSSPELSFLGLAGKLRNLTPIVDRCEV